MALRTCSPPTFLLSPTRLPPHIGSEDQMGPRYEDHLGRGPQRVDHHRRLAGKIHLRLRLGRRWINGVAAAGPATQPIQREPKEPLQL